MKNGSDDIKILCVGVGGAGTNVINRMKDIGVPNAEFRECKLNCVKLQ